MTGDESNQWVKGTEISTYLQS